jgi:hypothetical protein
LEVLKKESKFNYIIFLLILSHFLFGFLIQENAGGGKIDEIHVLNNLKLFESISFLEINWLKYDSSSLPLFYIIYNFLIDTNNYSYILYLNLIVSIFSFIFFYKSLTLVFIDLSKDKILVLASCLLLSPYFRTSTFFTLEENLPILFILSGFYFFLKLKLSNFVSIPNLILCLISLGLAIYGRSNYIIIYIIVFFSLFRFKNFFCRNNLLAIFLTILFAIPGFFLIYHWGGIIPPIAQHRLNDNPIQFNLIPIILNIILIYALPFFLLEFRKIKKFIFNKRMIYFIIVFPIYYFVFQKMVVNYYGGGSINKLLFLIFNEDYIKNLTIVISYFSLIIIYTLFFRNYFILSFLILCSILFQNLLIIFQEYFDPILMIIFLLFGGFECLKKNKTKYILISYFYFFLISALFFQSQLA